MIETGPKMHNSATVTFISSTNEPEALFLAAKCAQLTWEVADVTQNKEISVWSRKARVQNQRESIYTAALVGCFTQLTSLRASPRSLPVSLNCRILTVPQSEAEPLKSSCVDNLASDSGFAAPQHSLMWQHISSQSRWDVTHSFSPSLSFRILFFFFFVLWPTLAALWRKRKKKSQRNNKAVPQYIKSNLRQWSHINPLATCLAVRVHKRTHVGA